ncbi:type II secretion system protein [Rubellicoccus peritrichatus]|uniref:Type II secretion system protein n=1 Tax=Rubellicoccus peritrichatus TaxID=3080537 RepID=A0AAQ3QXM2_9BACT|nr:type II secretion system protein [Puniceicoccus sp. CR14]WOO43187.1 type II secretion system protein [Puniceicoccus sp. CR14]
MHSPRNNKSQSQTRHRRRGAGASPTQTRAFSLIELLVVIAVIGILAGILIPVLGSARQNGNMVNDLSNLRQIGNAISMYVSENQLRLPHPTDAIKGTDTGNGNRWTFYEAVDRYFDEGSGFNPASIYNYQRREVWYASNAGEVYNGSTRAIGFAPNPYIFNGRWQGRMLNVPSPASIVLMAETLDWPGGGQYDFNPTREPTYDSDLTSVYRVSQPGNQALYLFGDFRVDALEGDQSEPTLKKQDRQNMWRWW